MIRFISSLTGLAYTRVLKPIFFLCDPEPVHNFMVGNGKLLSRVGFAKSLMARTWSYSDRKLKKKIDGLSFPNPIGLSAGFDYDADLVEILPAVGFGFHTIGTVTLNAYEGNPPPRLSRFPKSRALLVNKGLKNIGAIGIIWKLQHQEITIPLGISIASTNRKFNSEAEQIKDITDCFQLFETARLNHAYYELNISCPNTYGGEPFTTPAKLARLMAQMDALKLSRPLYVKMPIDQSDHETKQLLKTLMKHRVQGVIFGNLTKDKANPAVDASEAAEWKHKKGNLSGKPTWDRSNHCIQLAREYCGSRFTIIGTGGVFSGEDAATKLALGADLVQLITGMIYQGPQVIGQINYHLAQSR